MPTPDNTVALVGLGVAALTGVGAPLITVLAGRRQLTARLAHERGMHDREESRDRLDSAVEKGEEVFEVLSDVHSLLAVGDFFDASNRLATATVAYGQLGAEIRRLMLRRGRQDPIVEQLRGYEVSLRELIEHLGAAINHSVQVDDATWTGLVAATGQAQSAVIDWASYIVGVNEPRT